MKVAHIYIPVMFLLLTGSTARAQHQIGVEFQAYPAGQIASLNYGCSLGTNGALEARIGYNFIDHRDQGVQDDEKGGGFGGSIGYTYRIWNLLRLGARADVWWNTIDWKMDPGTPLEITGTTKVTVFQPTLTLDYPIPLGNWVLIPRIAFGAEINVQTDGEKVGQGAILLGGVGFARVF
ncbi:MAG: hypothetical protein K9I85_08745 [Saprospiraceae bacterium]|nr:hypothetical protein [Saprospiraceae bacterium]